MNQMGYLHVCMNENNIGPTGLEALATFDLNLLVAFDALVRECSVTRAARRLSVSQSAMSHTLKRLRTLFEDPLLVRGRSGMLLTPRAEALVLPIRSGLVALSRAVTQPPNFDPATASCAFKVATPDLFNALAMPRLITRIRREAPGIDLGLRPVREDELAGRLETGELDLAIVPWMEGLVAENSRTAPGLVRRLLFKDHFVSFARAGHPVLKCDPVSLEDFLALSHALVSPSGEGQGLVDLMLSKMGRSRRVALRVPDFQSAASLVRQSDLVLTAPASLAQVADVNLVPFTTPLPLPTHSLNMVWHTRFTADPGHCWLRHFFASVADIDGLSGRSNRGPERTR